MIKLFQVVLQQIHVVNGVKLEVKKAVQDKDKKAGTSSNKVDREFHKYNFSKNMYFKWLILIHSAELTSWLSFWGSKTETTKSYKRLIRQVSLRTNNCVF